jgi:DNA-binding transcriptional MerR regulator
MVSQPARRLRSSRQSKGKSASSANPAHTAGGPDRPLKIGEAARLLGVEAYVLRFWETQFSNLRPYHTATKHRLYSEQDVEALRLIKRLLYEEGFTIEGARKRIKELASDQGNVKGMGGSNSATTKPTKAQTAPKAAASALPIAAARQALIDIRRDLESLYRLLKG